MTIFSTAFVVSVPIFFISILIEIFFNSHKKISNVSSKIWFISLLVILASILFIVNSDKTQYKVLIDDSVTYNELCKKYDVIDTDGKIVTIEEKEFK